MQKGFRGKGLDFSAGVGRSQRRVELDGPLMAEED